LPWPLTLVAVVRELFEQRGELLGVTVFIPVLLQASAGLSPTDAGLLLATMTIGLTVSTTAAGRRIARTGRMRRLPVLGASLMAAALSVLALNAPSASIGIATATTSFFRAFGGATGAAALGAIFAAGSGEVGDAVQAALFAAAAVAALAAVVLAALPSSVNRT
jgi:hypothetical protein